MLLWGFSTQVILMQNFVFFFKKKSRPICHAYLSVPKSIYRHILNIFSIFIYKYKFDHNYTSFVWTVDLVWVNNIPRISLHSCNIWIWIYKGKGNYKFEDLKNLCTQKYMFRCSLFSFYMRLYNLQFLIEIRKWKLCTGVNQHHTIIITRNAISLNERMMMDISSIYMVPLMKHYCAGHRLYVSIFMWQHSCAQKIRIAFFKQNIVNQHTFECNSHIT